VCPSFITAGVVFSKFFETDLYVFSQLVGKHVRDVIDNWIPAVALAADKHIAFDFFHAAAAFNAYIFTLSSVSGIADITFLARNEINVFVINHFFFIDRAGKYL